MASNDVCDLESASKWLCDEIINTENGWSAGKIGTSELNALIFYIKRSNSQSKIPYPQYIVKEMTQNAGFWNEPKNSIDLALDSWAEAVIEAVKNINAIAIWNPISKIEELQIITHYAPATKKIVLRALEPYYSPTNQYTLHMIKGPIAVVSPFADSIKKQWLNRHNIFPKDGLAGQMWPHNQVLIAIKAPYGPALTQNTSLGWPEHILQQGHQEAVKYLADQVVQSGAKYAFVGIGALSLLLVNELKKQNIIAIHTGGGTQIMFGVKGNRWSNHSIISGFFNNSWIKPSVDETPSGAQQVERSCYW
jgi:hypothetical protein